MGNLLVSTTFQNRKTILILKEWMYIVFDRLGYGVHEKGIQRAVLPNH
jgi:hypothetical protein